MIPNEKLSFSSSLTVISNNESKSTISFYKQIDLALLYNSSVINTDFKKRSKFEYSICCGNYSVF